MHFGAGNAGSDDIDHVNHVGMAVRDLKAIATRFEELGFILTPFSPHSGAWKPGDKVQSLASGNRCIMFGDNYLEILASENPAAPAPRISNFLNRHQGAHIICFNTEKPEQVDQRLRANGVSTSGVIPLQREIDTPDGVKTAKFQRVQFAPDESPEGYIQAARHLTPEYIYQPRYTAHPNGSEMLRDTYLVTDDVERFADKYARYLGRPARHENGVTLFEFEQGSRLLLITSEQARKLLPGSLIPPPPCIAAVSFVTRDLQGQRERLGRLALPFAEVDGRLVLPAEETGGLAFVFEQSRG